MIAAVGVGLLMVAVLTAGLPYVLDASIDDSKHLNSVDSETWTPQTGTPTVLDNSELARADYNDTVTVRNSSGATMTEGSDYTWHETNGTVEALSGGDLDGESSAEIDYGWTGQTKRQERMTDILVDGNAVLVPMSVFAFVVLLVAVVGAMRGL